MSENIILENGKYEFIKDDKGKLICKRYGQPWREFVGDNAVHALFDYAVETTSKNCTCEKVLDNISKV